MSTLYLGADPRSLADRLADELDASAKHGDFFETTLVVVPNRCMRKWLRLHLARRLDVAINLRFEEIDAALWQILTHADPRSGVAVPEPIDENLYRLMMLSVLLDEDDSELAPLRRYLQLQEAGLARLSCRRAWHLADRLGLLLRDYEEHRQDELIQRWLKYHLGLKGASEFHQMMERAQRALFLHITREPDGKRALLNRLGERTLKSLPQYAMELLTLDPREGKQAVHFFGFSHLADLHARAITWLAASFDVRFYHLNAATSAIESVDLATLPAIADGLREADGSDIARLWGRAGAESLGLIARRFSAANFLVERVTDSSRPRGKRSVSVLARLHDNLLGRAKGKTRLEQDCSLQIVGCPGPMREAETVCNSILFNLHENKTLRQTDIAVLVTDMTKYRPILQAVFERPPRRLTYNMLDYSAANTSTFGQALLGMLDLALDSFSRAHVFQVVLNPCFLAKLGIDRTAATVWLDWADSLGVYQGWDAQEKEEQGYPRSPFYAWRLGLQRLRLGRYMDVVAEDDGEPAPRYGHIIPFADLASGDRDQLDAFCQAIEGLLPTLTRLRRANMTGERWAIVLRRLIHEFLEVPEDRPEEGQVREAVLAALEPLTSWDALQPALRKSRGLPLALVREYVQSQLEALEGHHGEYLTGGVTIAQLQPMRAVPFAIVYVLGLGDDLFPGSNALSSFDLRGVQRIPGDIRPAEQRLYDFLATILSAQQKLYLLYSNHNLQKDQALLPAVPVQQLQRYLGQHILEDRFEAVTMPVALDDIRYVDPTRQPKTQDVLVQYREAERSLSLRAVQRNHQLALTAAQQTELVQQYKSFQQDFTLAAEPNEAPAKTHLVALGELRRFLQMPALAALRRHLHIDEDDEAEAEDDEPLVTGQRAANALVRQTIQQLLQSATKTGVKLALQSWQERFTAAYADARLRSQVPEEAFGEIDQAALRRDLMERIHGAGQIESFLREHEQMTFCGPVLIGESMTPLGARLRFPALRLRPGDEGNASAAGEIRIVGSMSQAWHTPERFEVLIVTNTKKIDAREVSASLFEPMLFYLAMLAGTETNRDGIASQAWLMTRETVLHVAHQGGIARWTLPAGTISPVEALAYLVELTRDFLDPTQFDLLPFELLSVGPELKRAYDSTFTGQVGPGAFRELLQDKIVEARESTFGRPKIPPLVEMIQAKLPEDALAKVQRRFRLLDRAPALVRRQPKATKTKRASKS